MTKLFFIAGLFSISGAVDAFADAIPTSAGSILSNGKTYEVTSDVTIGRTSGLNGLVVADGATTTIDIAEGKTLTVYGADGSGLTAGKAGILLPSGSTLNITGNGTIKVYGGNAGNGANGTNGGSSFVSRDGNNTVTIKSISGVGGNGGGGAGAAIGSDGGNGGTRTESHTEFSDGFTQGSAVTGPWSCTGDHSQVSTPGDASATYGTLNIAPSVNSILVGGSAGASGKSGRKGYLYKAYNSYNIYASTGGAGGGGGAGGAGADYGRGGNGGSTGSKGTCGQTDRTNTPAEGANGSNGANGTSFFTGSSSSANSAISLTNGQTLNITDDAIYYESGKSGITVSSGATATINIPKGKTLTVYGAAGKAGIDLPSGAALYIKGLGTLKVYGGAAGNGDNGENGIGMYDKYDTPNVGNNRAFLISRAGYGGNGGFGAGAAIGSNGGNGATREEGDISWTDTFQSAGTPEPGEWSGPAYSRTSNSGAAAPTCGTLHIDKTINVVLLGGVAGSKGNVGLKSAIHQTLWNAVCYMAPGGYGGVGGSGGAGADFGCGGTGGSSGQKGGTGHSSRGDGHANPVQGANGNDGDDGAKGEASAYTLDDVAITVTLDAQGGECASSVEVTYLGKYSSLPVPTLTGFAFSGWYTATEGGTKVETTSTVTNKENHTLYAHWTQSVIVSASGYATVFSDRNLVVPANAEVYGFTYSDGALIQGDVIAGGAILPANKGYLVKATAGTYNFAPTSAAATAYESVLAGTTDEIGTPSGDVYVWGKPEGYSYGWYKYTGAKIPAGRAYYVKSK